MRRRRLDIDDDSSVDVDEVVGGLSVERWTTGGGGPLRHRVGERQILRRFARLALVEAIEVLANGSTRLLRLAPVNVAVARHSTPLPPAIVLDLDESVWSNARYEARIVRRYGTFSLETFSQWCRESTAPVLPGAKEFLEYAHSRGVAIFYYSSRHERLRGCTQRNLGAQGLPVAGRADRLLLNDGTGKAEHRRRVSRDFRILLLVGDNLEDFADGYKDAPAARKRVVERYREYWGTRWIMLPNPVYGHWEASFYEFDYAMPRAEQLKRKSNGLEP